MVRDPTRIPNYSATTYTGDQCETPAGFLITKSPQEALSADCVGCGLVVCMPFGSSYPSFPFSIELSELCVKFHLGTLHFLLLVASWSLSFPFADDSAMLKSQNTLQTGQTLVWRFLWLGWCPNSSTWGLPSYRRWQVQALCPPSLRVFAGITCVDSMIYPLH